jgi:hypothetical protein
MKRRILSLIIAGIILSNIYFTSNAYLNEPSELEIQAMGVQTRWDFELDEWAGSSPTVADFDRDGYFEVIVTCLDGSLLCLDYQGNELWSFETGSPARYPLIVDIDNNGDLEILFGTNGFRVYCVEAGGTLKWMQTVETAVYGIDAIDLDNDGVREVIVSGYRYVYCLSNEGTLLWSFYLDTLDGSEEVAIGDVDGDSKYEIIVVDYIANAQWSSLYCLNTTGGVRWKRDYSLGLGNLITADTDSDGKDEIFNSNYNAIMCVDENGYEVWRTTTGTSTLNELQVCDIDNDSELELVFYGGGGGFIHHVNGITGVLERTLDIDWSPHLNGFCIADLDNNGKYEYIYSTWMEKKVVCLDDQGNSRWLFGAVYWPSGTPCAIDLDRDGVFEILFIQSKTGELSRISCMELSDVSKSGNAPWYCEKGTIARTNYGDHDFDLLDTVSERFYGIDEENPDSDSDGILDGLEVFSIYSDPANNDTDGDLLLDGWELEYGLDPIVSDATEDFDNDGLTNIDEVMYGTDVFSNDTDADDLSDFDEIFIYFTTPTNNDTDFDLLNDYEEIFTYSTLPNNNDSDNDTMIDGWEVSYSLDPLTNDTSLDPDLDTLTNLEEFQLNSNPQNNDTDSDNLADNDEVYIHFTDLLNDDTDFDDLIDGDEVIIHLTLPNDNDTDDDLILDGWEIRYSLNPLVNDSYLDYDTDGLINFNEFIHDCDPYLNDTDFDNITDGEEVLVYGLNPLSNDTDSDLLYDYDELFIYSTDPDINDTDSDNCPDGWEVFCGLNPFVDDSYLDPDIDELTNLQEFQHSTLPLINDTDSDLILDGWEVTYELNPLVDDSYLDFDEDGLTNYEEFILGSDPTDVDSDDDLIDDWSEYFYGFDPLDPTDAYDDADDDGLNNVSEFVIGYNPISNDTDSDGLPDGWEFYNNLNPLDPTDVSEDLDGDGLINSLEYYHGTKPDDTDSDDDGYSDFDEVKKGSDPTDPSSNPATMRRNMWISLNISAFSFLLLLVSYIMWNRRYQKKKLLAEKEKTMISLGFISIEEMDRIHSLGFMSKSEYNTIKSLGFDTKLEYLTDQLGYLLLDSWLKSEELYKYKSMITKARSISKLEELKEKILEIDKFLSKTQYLIDDYDLLEDGLFNDSWISSISNVQNMRVDVEGVLQSLDKKILSLKNK